MKIFIAVVLVAIVGAEPPPSNSYLPPAPNSNNGYPSGGPELIAARSFNQGVARGFGRNSNHGSAGHQSKFNAAQADFGHHAGNFRRSGFEDPSSVHGVAGYHSKNAAYAGPEQLAGNFRRSGYEDPSSEPAQYNFGYAVTDDYEGTDFGHIEHRDNQKAAGEYHVVLPDGRKQTVSYEADERGFKPKISYQETNGNGYNDNAQNGAFGVSRAKAGY